MRHRHRHHGYRDSVVHSAHRSGGGRTAGMIQAGLEMGVTSATAFTWGAVHGRFGVISPMGVSLDLIVGVLSGVASLFDLGGKNEYVNTAITSVATGSLASFFNRKGVQLGTSWRAGAPLTNPALPGSGIFGGEFARSHGGMPVPNAGAVSITEQELAAMARHAAAR